MAEDGKVKIEKFDGHDYGYWRMQVEDLLYQKSLHLPMLGLSYRPEKMTDAEWNLLDRQALGVVRLSLSKSVAYNIVKETTTFGVLKALSNMYEKPSASNKVFLIRQLVNTKLVLSIVASENLHLEQLDVKTAFLHGDLDEDIYMVQPEGFQISGKENMVCKLKKSLYGLKQAPRQWYLKFDNFMGRNGFKRCEMDHCCYIKKFSKSYIILLLYVDDMLIAGSDMKEINKLKKQMSEKFEMKDLGAAKQILGMSIFRNSKDGSLTLSQEKYIGKVLEKFSMKNARARNTPLGIKVRSFDQLGTRIRSIEVEIEEFSERHVATYKIAYRRRSRRFCTAFRYVRYGSRDVGTSAFPVTMV
ncbi:hypothetical protein E3N88_05058 [Mikania micrantha]|uniref:Reverse transcriptase Ty1/copia-type domain-containing protein n=1 Tax=Mikania micrantha TaxID=192012 RepID=A0A5N6PYY3_9ASTR|nr:hypothetical protein E3N88_05058 [Mikania micrantha]